MKSTRVLPLLALVGATGALAQTAPPQTPPGFPSGTDPGWLGTTCGNNTTSDPVDDAGNQSQVNLVGDLARPAGSVLTRGDFLFIRLRLDDDPATPDLVEKGWSVAFDQDGDLRTFEHLIMVNGKGNPENIEFAENTNTTGEINDSDQVAETLLDLFPTSTFTKVEVTTDGNIDGEAIADQDHWLIFAIPWRDADPTTVTLEDEGYTPDDTLVLWFGSSNSSRNLSLDISCAGTTPTDLDDAGSDPTPLDPNSDDDGDGIPNFRDNCRFVDNGTLQGPNNQTDTDGDGIGDVCDVADQSTPEDISLTFSGTNGNRLQVTHLTEGTTNVTLTVTTGTLTLSTLTGLTFTAGDGTADATMTFTGLRSAVDTALNGLVYTPPLNFNGAVTLTFAAGRVNNVTRTNRVAITVTPVDDAPVNTVPGAQTINEDTATSPLVLSVTDIDSTSLTVTLTSLNGTARLATTTGLTSVSGDGTATITLVGTLAALNTAMNGVVFTPSLNFNGAASLTMLSAGVTASDEDSIAITVNAVNDAPSNTVPGTQTTLEDNALLFSLATGNQLLVTDIDSGSLTVTVAVSSGVVSLGGTGGLTFGAGDGTDDATVTFRGTIADVNAALSGLLFTPALNFNSDIGGLVTLSLTSNDLAAAAVTSTVSIDVDPVNDAPVAVDDTASTDEDASVLVNVVNNDTDVDNNVGNLNAGLSVTAVSGAVNGTAVIEGGQVRFTPTANFNGTGSFDYTVSDGVLTDTGSVTVTVAAVNDAPVANDDSATTDEDAVVTVDVLANDTDIDNAGNSNAGLTITALRAITNGSAQIVAGRVEFTPTANFNGTASFIYDISDGLITVSATVTITVNSVNDAPDAVDDEVLVIEDTETLILVLANDSDIDGDDLNITAVSSARATIAADRRSVTYTPALNSNDPDSFTYTVSDPSGATDTATVRITIDPVNDAPVVFVPGDQETDEDSALTFSAIGTTPNGITVVDVDTATITVTLTAENGTLDIDQASGAGVTGEGTGIVTITGTAAQVNAALEGLLFLPDDDLNSRDDDFSLTVSVSDGGAPVSGVIDILVNAVNDAPTGDAITASTNEDTPVVINAIGGAVDIDGDPLVAVSATDPAGGTVSIDGATGVVTFTPDANFNGVTTFDVVVSDGNGGTVTRTVTVTVNAVNDAPVVVLPGAQSTDEDTVLVLTEDNNDIAIVDVDGDVVTVSLTATNGTLNVRQLTGVTITDGANGTAFIEVTGTAAAVTAALENLEFTPNENFNGQATIVVTATDEDGLSDSETLDITIRAVNDAPVAEDDVAGAELDPILVDVLANDSDVDGDDLNIAAIGTPVVAVGSTLANAGTLEIVDIGGRDQVRYTPTPGFNGSFTVEITITDGQLSDTSILTVGVSGDRDLDGIPDVLDNCVDVANTDQINTDNDNPAVGDACDDDDDDDGVPDTTDNCRIVQNLDQINTDRNLPGGDLLGDACDDDDDADGDDDSNDNCPLAPNADQLNTDLSLTGGDLLGDACDDDDDADGDLDVNDNCVTTPNADQQNSDTDALGDACDPDDDNDGDLDGDDNCPLVPNADQLNTDLNLTGGDALGDACDDDDDADGDPDTNDNCVTTPNADQLNSDTDALGNACDDDDDNDGVPDDEDNCPVNANANQADNDGDGDTVGGDVCDPDDDNDTVPDGTDNCQFIQNLNQADLDRDGIGDVCDGDDDGDGGPNGTDNCPGLPNPDQRDTDGDGIGDACDGDDDNDGDDDGEDNCPLVANADQLNTDGDALGNACDDDDDGDGDNDGNDNCPLVVNADQANNDGDSLGDACDPDDDNDGEDDGDDNCQFDANANQSDIDNDGIGDACDDDRDGDSVNDVDDNCPDDRNADQVDTDGDDTGDVCDDDDDNDGVNDVDDNCPLVSNDGQENSDGDDDGDACDGDADGDGIANEADNCEFAANDDQSDIDLDGIGDVCDDDSPFSVGGGGVVSSCGQTDAPSLGLFGLAALALLPLRRRRRAA